MKRFNLMITEEMHEAIQKSAQKRGLTMNAVVIVAVETYFHTQHAVDAVYGAQQQMGLEELKRRALEDQKPD